MPPELLAVLARYEKIDFANVTVNAERIGEPRCVRASARRTALAPT